MVSWSSGLRRHVKVKTNTVFRKGVGSNPTLIKFYPFECCKNLLWPLILILVRNVSLVWTCLKPSSQITKGLSFNPPIGIIEREKLHQCYSWWRCKNMMEKLVTGKQCRTWKQARGRRGWMMSCWKATILSLFHNTNPKNESSLTAKVG